MFHSLSKPAKHLGLVFILATSSFPAFSQQNSIASLAKSEARLGPEGNAQPEPKDDTEKAAILASFVAAENRVRESLNQHTFKRDVVLQTIGPNGEITGEYIRNSQFLFDDRGRRIERVLYRPPSTIREMRITKEDIQDLAGSQLLGIDIVETTKYRLNFAGTETVDSRQLLAIDVIPLVDPNPNKMSERFFVGRVWVDPTTFQIVKIKGIVEPQGKQRFPMFETWREPVRNALAFPTRTEADDVLHFRERDVHYRIKVRYYDYQLFGSKVSIKELDEDPSATEAGPKANEAAPPKLREKPSLKTSTSSSKGETKMVAVAPNQVPVPVMKLRKSEACATNRTAPPVGAYHWPADSAVKVFFLRNMFTADQRAALLDAMGAWSTASTEIGSGVKFIDAGETEIRETCRGCLTVRRRDVYKQDKHHYAFFYPMNLEGNRLLISAWIDLDFQITNPKALKGFMVHELAHGLGLWDCTTCKKKLTIMNAFPGINKDNGLVTPSTCDLATVKGVYDQERQVAALNLPADKQREALRVANVLALPPLGLAQTHFSVLELQPPMGAAAIKSPTVSRETATGPASILGLPALGLDRPSFSALHPQVSRKSTLWWSIIF